jgi:hypothetical protein
VVLSSVDTSDVSANVPDEVAFPVMRVFEEMVVEESVVEESVALVPKTNAPLPVSSVTSEASSEEVSIEVDDTLLLKRDQSEVERRPRFAEDAVGILNVMVLPLAVMVKSVPVVELARVTDGPVCDWPVGPMPVIPPPAPVLIQFPLIAKQPPERLMPPEE